MDEIKITLPPSTRASSGVLRFGVGGNGMTIKAAWSAVPNTSTNSSTVSATLTIYANARGTAKSGSHLTINGNKKLYTTRLASVGNLQSTHVLCTHSVVVPHNSDGTKTITISGSFIWRGYLWDGKHYTFDTISGSGSATLPTIIVGTPPTNARVSLDKTGVVEGRVNVSVAYDCTNPYGTVSYKYGRSTDGVNWVESDWISSKSAGYTITDIQRGATHRFRAKVKNGKGESDWSSAVSVKANSIPSTVTSLSVNTTRPINSVTLNWGAASDADGQTITYKVYISKNGGSKQLIGTTTSTSLAYNISSDGYGTKYKYYVDAYDTLGVYSSSAASGEFIKATPPSNPAISLNKSGTIEGSVSATGSYSCTYPGGTAQYQFAYYYDGIGWQEQGWSTSNSFSIDTSSQRGKWWYFKVRVKNDVGTSGWSSTSSVKSNSIPTPATGLKHSPTYPVNSVTLSWTKATDADNQTLTYKVYISKNGGAWTYITSTTATSCTYDNSADAYETKYKFIVEAYDTFNKYSTSSASAEFFKPTPPSVPTITSPTNSIFEHDFSIKWTLSNFHKLKGNYVSQKRVNNGEWVQLIPTSTMSTSTFSISSINRGDSVQFRVKAVNEAGQESAWSTIVTAKRNRLPLTVSNILPATGYLLNVIDFSWSATTDPDGQSVKYNLYISKNGGSFISLGTTTNLKYKWAIPGADVGETTYQLKVESEDSLGATSSIVGPVIKKPTPPTKPSGLKPGNGYYEGSINFSWTHSNWYSQSGQYTIEVYVNGVLNKTATVAHTVSSYNYSLSGVPRGAKIHYRIKAKNDFEQQSDWIESTSVMYHNQIPEAPKFILPLTNKSVFSKSPKIVLQSATEVDGQKMTMFVVYNGVTYSSSQNTDVFSKTNLGNNEYIIFKPNTTLNVGSNTIKAYVSDGLINSSTVSTVIVVENPVSSVAKDQIISASSYNERANAIKKTKEAYGMSANSTQVKQNIDFISANGIVSLINELKELTSKIDSYHTNNKFAYALSYSTPSKSTNYIQPAYFNQISNAINNI